MISEMSSCLNLFDIIVDVKIRLGVPNHNLTLYNDIRDISGFMNRLGETKSELDLWGSQQMVEFQPAAWNTWHQCSTCHTLGGKSNQSGLIHQLISIGFWPNHKTIFHQPRVLWNKKISLHRLPFSEVVWGGYNLDRFGVSFQPTQFDIYRPVVIQGFGNLVMGKPRATMRDVGLQILGRKFWSI